MKELYELTVHPVKPVFERESHPLRESFIAIGSEVRTFATRLEELA
jgi:hypothetical protein